MICRAPYSHRTHVVRTAPTCGFVHFFKSGSPRVVARSRARSPCSAFLFHSFSLRLFRQRKAAEKSWYEYLVPLTMIRVYRLSAFSFEEVAPKEKAPQKEKGRMSPARRAVTFLRKSNQKTFLFVWCSANNVRVGRHL